MQPAAKGQQRTCEIVTLPVLGATSENLAGWTVTGRRTIPASATGTADPVATQAQTAARRNISAEARLGGGGVGLCGFVRRCGAAGC